MTSLATLGALDAALTVICAGTVSAQETPRRLSADEIAAMSKGGAGAGTSGVTGITTTVISGDPSAAGPYTIEIRVPPRTRIGAHRHRDDRSGVVISGAWRIGYGERADLALTKVLGPGGFYTEPANQAHFAQTGDQAAVVYVTGFGPTDTRYVEPADDPRSH